MTTDGSKVAQAQKDVLTVEEAAELLQLTPPTIRQMATRGLIPHKRYGRMFRFSRRQLIADLEAGNPIAQPNAPSRYATGLDAQSVIEAFHKLPAAPMGRNRRTAS